MRSDVIPQSSSVYNELGSMDTAYRFLVDEVERLLSLPLQSKGDLARGTLKRGCSRLLRNCPFRSLRDSAMYEHRLYFSERNDRAYKKSKE